MLYRDYRYVENYPGYIISNFGEVFSTKRSSGKQLKRIHDKDGYLICSLSNNGREKTYKIHVLVGNAFIGLRTGELTFDHLDRDKLNNRADNIRLATKSEQNENRAMYKSNTSGFENISYYKHKLTENEYYKLQIERNKKLIIRHSFNKKKYNLEDVIKIRDDLIAKHNHEVLLNKVHIELLCITDFVRSI